MKTDRFHRLQEDYRKVQTEFKGDKNFFTSQMIKNCMKKVEFSFVLCFFVLFWGTVQCWIAGNRNKYTRENRCR